MELNQGRYQIGGVDLLQLAERHGTPLYVYDGNRIREQYQKIISAFDVPSLHIHYACKALTNINILKLLRTTGAYVDAVSIQEIRLALHVGYSPEQIAYTPNCVSEEEVDLALKLGVQLNVDNIDLLEHIGHHYPDTPIGIRINPHVMGGGHRKISVGHIDSKFGISIHQLPLVLRLVDTLGIKVNGAHMHTGSDILDVEIFMRAADILFDVARKFDELEYMDFGSGFKVAYREGDIATDIEDLGAQMSAKFNAFCKERGRQLTLIFEPGKFLVSEAGYFLTTVNVVKQTTSTYFAGVNSGFNHLIRPMFYNSYHEIVNVSNPEGKPRIYSVVGYICETDTFAYDRRIKTVEPGHVLCFRNAGAYCYMMSSNYNSRLLPAEVLIDEGQPYLIRKRQEWDSLLQDQVELDHL